MLVNCLTATLVNRLTAKLVVVNLVKLHLTKLKGTHLFYSKRVVAQRESRLFQNVFSAASETMTLIFGVTE